jgi:8-oxo-dGTP diphosphatase
LAKSKAKVIQAAGGILWREIDGQEQVMIVHRHKHKDWSLPKGKLNPGETWKQAAVREVQEETGFQPKVIEYAGSISYLNKGKPKIVLFWHMEIKKEDRSLMNGEVDDWQWLTIHDALNVLDYRDEKDLLVKEVRVRKKGT